MTETGSESIAIELILSVLFLPFVSFMICLVISEAYAWVTSLLGSLILLITFILVLVVVSQHWQSPDTIYSFNWFTIGNINIELSLVVSNTMLTMLIVVTFISLLVHLFSIGYMASDPSLRRYFAMLGFFTFSMIGVVVSDSLLLMFIFWELVGFSSFMLISHYHEKTSAAKAAKKAFIINRLADLGFIIGMITIFSATGTFSIHEIAQIEESTIRTFAGLCLFVGVIGKSAQLPFFTWLPDAMQGPTPVSALIHAATMVAAGVYMLVRIFPFFDPPTLLVIASIGGATALLGAAFATAQYDIKRVLAYSTISQLGLMIFATGISAPEAALFHLVTHAAFKACLFLGAGAIIHAGEHAQHQMQTNFDPQDIRHMGGLRKRIPVTFLTTTIAAASLVGLPFFSGFLSKETILLGAMQLPEHSFIATLVILFVSFLTALYSFRLIWFVFLKRNDNLSREYIVEAPVIMRIPLIILAGASMWFAFSVNPFSPSGWVIRQEVYSITPAVISSLVVISGLLVSWFLYRKQDSVISVFHNGLFIDRGYQLAMQGVLPFVSRLTHYIDNRILNRSLHAVAYVHVTAGHVISWTDRYILDGIVDFIVMLIATTGRFFRAFQSGKIQLYIFWSMLAIIIFLIWSLN